MRLSPLVALISILWAGNAYADGSLTAGPAKTKVGLPVKVTLAVKLLPGETLVAPASIKLPANAELRATARPEPAKEPDGMETHIVAYEIVMYDTGPVELGPVKYVIQSPDGAEREESAGPVNFAVEPVTPAGANVMEEVKKASIKEPAVTSLTFWDIAVPIIVVTLLAAIAYLLYRRFKGRNKTAAPAVAPPPVPSRPPHETALAKLRELKSEDLFAMGLRRDHFFRVSSILREYVEERYGVLALESTTMELEERFDGRYVDFKRKTAFISILQTCDMVKFAKSEPELKLADETLDNATKFVMETAPKILEGETA
ncbi:MAG: hypothetical protein HY751_03855 [Nitrospinae bacterium]|nr:hypothetical protein [Nitrospinota bacterium]